MSIKLKLQGFDELFTAIQKAGGSIDKATEVCMKQSADTMQKEIKTQMSKAGVDGDLINKMPQPELFKDGNAYVAMVGYKKGSYNEKNPSTGYKVVFLNYGTPHRSKHGKVKARGFIQKAKRKATPQIKKQQEETLKDILSRFEK